MSTETAPTEYACTVHRDMPAEDYHAALGVSNSMLKRMDPTPAHFQAYLTEPFEATPAMILGTLAHSLVLEPEKDLPSLAIKPEDMKFSTREGKEWRAAQRAAGNLIITTDAYRSLVGMVESIAAHPVASKIVKNAETELSLFARNPAFDEFFGADNPLLKCRLDIAPVGNFLADVKTCEDAGDDFAKTVFNYGYYQQAAYYIDLWNLLHPHDPKEHFIFIAVEKSPPYAVRVVKLKQAAIRAGRGLYVQRLARYVDCVKANHWPAYPTDIQEIDIPAWAHASLERKAA